MTITNIPIFKASTLLGENLSKMEAIDTLLGTRFNIGPDEKTTRVRHPSNDTKILSKISEYSNILPLCGVLDHFVEVTYRLNKNRAICDFSWKPIRGYRKPEYDSIMVEVCNSTLLKIKVPLRGGWAHGKSAHDVIRDTKQGLNNTLLYHADILDGLDNKSSMQELTLMLLKHPDAEAKEESPFAPKKGNPSCFLVLDVKI